MSTASRPSSFSVNAGLEKDTVATDVSSIHGGAYDNDADVDLELLQQRARIRQENIRQMERRLKGDPTAEGSVPRPSRRSRVGRAAEDSSVTSTDSSIEGGSPSRETGGNSPKNVEKPTQAPPALDPPTDARRRARGVAPPQSSRAAETPIYAAQAQGEDREPLLDDEDPTATKRPSGISWTTVGLAVAGGILLGAGSGLLLGKFVFFGAQAAASSSTVPAAGASIVASANAINAASSASGPAAVTAATKAAATATAAKSSTAAVNTAMVTAAHQAAMDTSVTAATTSLGKAAATATIAGTESTATASLPWAQAAAFGACTGAVGAVTAGTITACCGVPARAPIENRAAEKEMNLN
eukprot:PhM_4_TR5778/c0_g1_i1/m.30670